MASTPPKQKTLVSLTCKGFLLSGPPLYPHLHLRQRLAAQQCAWPVGIRIAVKADTAVIDNSNCLSLDQ